MATTNPTKFVTVRRLARFHEKIQSELPNYATMQICESIIDELT